MPIYPLGNWRLTLSTGLGIWLSYSFEHRYQHQRIFFKCFASVENIVSMLRCQYSNQRWKYWAGQASRQSLEEFSWRLFLALKLMIHQYFHPTWEIEGEGEERKTRGEREWLRTSCTSENMTQSKCFFWGLVSWKKNGVIIKPLFSKYLLLLLLYLFSAFLID